jgi:hypothetical protein
MNSAQGQVLAGFEKWKTIPSPEDKEMLKKGTKFERRLYKFFVESLKLAFVPFKVIYQSKN